MAYAYYKQDDADNAIKYYNSSIALKADGYVPYIGLGDVYKDLKKDNDEALKNYLKAIENKPENEKSQYNIGWCYNEKEQYNEAIPYLKKAILINKDYLKANRELGYSYYALGEYSNAQALFNKTISLDKKDELSFYYSGLCYVEMKDKTAALKMYDSLQELQSTYADKLKTKIDSM